MTVWLSAGRSQGRRDRGGVQEGAIRHQARAELSVADLRRRERHPPAHIRGHRPGRRARTGQVILQQKVRAKNISLLYKLRERCMCVLISTQLPFML